MEFLLGGQWTDRKNKIQVCSKYDQSLVAEVAAPDEADALKAIEIAERGAKIARQLPTHKRIDILKKAVAYIDQRQEEYARTIAGEGIKTIREARWEVKRAMMTLTNFAEEARRISGETLPFDSMPGSENRRGYYVREPLGIISAVVSYNDPLNLCAHKLGPAFAAGNAVILKPSELTPMSALKLGEAFIAAGLPGEMLSILPGRPQDMGTVLFTDPRIRMVSFTGGVKTGEKITKIAGLKKLQMELGSNSPVIVMDDARMDEAVPRCVSGAFAAGGQNCIGVQRIYVMESVYDAFVDAFVIQTKKLKAGNTLDESSDLGPMVSAVHAEHVSAMVENAVANGAEVRTGGSYSGTVFQPTVLTGVSDAAQMDCEEIFGPVVAIYSIKSLEEGIELANKTNYGLNAAIFTESLRSAMRATEDIQAGTVLVNDSTDYRIDLMPFGGIKNSGLGREGIKNSILEMTETKTVCFNL